MVNTYPGAKIVPAHPTKYRVMSPKRQTYDSIIIHVTDGHEDPMRTARMFATPYAPPPASGQPDKRPDDAKRRSSAHFVVGRLSEEAEPVIQSVDIGDVAYHAHSANERSVGIEHCCRTPGEFGPRDAGLAPTEAQYEKSAKLAAWLCRAAGLSVDRKTIRGHAEADPLTTHTSCPDGPGWNWNTYMTLVQAAYDRLAAVK